MGEVKEIITIDTDNDNFLNDRADEIDTRKENNLLREITLNLKETIRANKLSALSAPQIGYKKRVFCINFGKDIKTFINPVLTNVKGLEISKEICSSLPGKTYIRPRHNEIMFISQTPLGKTESLKLLGMSAKVFQHQLDHLDGLLLSDVGLEVGDDFLNASKEDQAEVIKMYLESLDIKQKEISKEIQEDEELNQVSKAIDFMSGVAKGDIKLVKRKEN